MISGQVALCPFVRFLLACSRLLPVVYSLHSIHVFACMSQNCSVKILPCPNRFLPFFRSTTMFSQNPAPHGRFSLRHVFDRSSWRLCVLISLPHVFFNTYIVPSSETTPSPTHPSHARAHKPNQTKSDQNRKPRTRPQPPPAKIRQCVCPPRSFPKTKNQHPKTPTHPLKQNLSHITQSVHSPPSSSYSVSSHGSWKEL